jgi:hypothetical protein
MDTKELKIKKNHKFKISNIVTRHKNVQKKVVKRPGLTNDAVYKDSASSIDVCI